MPPICLGISTRYGSSTKLPTPPVVSGCSRPIIALSVTRYRNRPAVLRNLWRTGEISGASIELASAMWRHSTNMRQAFAAKGIDWPTLSGQDLADILLYVRNLPATRGKPIDSTVTSENGKALFDSKGCIKCHTGKLDLAPRLKGKRLNDIAAAMWRSFTSDGDATTEPRRRPRWSQIVTYLWSEQVLGSSGRPAAGKKIFAAITARHAMEMRRAARRTCPGERARSRLYRWFHRSGSHGPKMLSRMKEKNLEWPRFTTAQMSDLIAYLNSAE